VLFSHVYYAHPMDLIHLEAESHFNSLCAHYVTFGLINGLLAPDAREINPNSRKGYTLGRLVAKWSEIGIISPDLLRPKVPEE
jgi:MOB kinase activator 1